MKRIAYILIFFCTANAYGQDPQFSQFYSNYLYLAPSFTGLTENNRLSTNYRNQWPEIPNGFVTYSVSFDKYFEKFRSGLGILVMQDAAGTGRLHTIDIGISYAYDFKISERWHIRPGMNLLYTERGINFNALKWNDQISAGGISPTTSEMNPTDDKVGDIDFSSSVLGYSDRFWFGITVDHILRPNQSFYFYEEAADNPAKVPVKYSFFGGTKFIKNESLLRPVPTTFQIAYLLKAQEKFRQLDIGVYWYRSPLVLGFWYRGIPLYKEVFNRDAFTVLTGYKLRNLSIGYSYDFTLSKLITRTGGSHEVSLSYYFKTKKLKRKPKMLPCPEF